MGAILETYFGPDGLDDHWLAPFNDDLRTRLARFYERSLTAVAKRMGELPGRTSDVLKRLTAEMRIVG